MVRRQGLEALLATKEMVLVCGSGGVGKTTMAAAMGLQAATELGGRVLVVTVDPARRLADALGLGAAGIGNAEVQVPPSALPEGARGELWVAMLDTKASWDDLIVRHGPSPEVSAAILANPLYRNLTSRFVHSHDYIVMEHLHDVHAAGRYDLVIVDTPPSRHALDILDAPSKMREFFASRLLRWLTVPGRSRVLSAASKPFYQVADRLLGGSFLTDIAEFFTLFQQMESGFVRRARQTEAMLSDVRTSFVVVTTLEAAPAVEAVFLVDELSRRGLPLGAVVANRVLPDVLSAPEARQAARVLVEHAESLAAELGPAAGTSSSVAARVLTTVGRSFAEFALVAARQSERRAELAARCPLLIEVGWLDRELDDLAGLAAVGQSAWAGG
jgi:anion-transporting  ArsA/GET3 family ATPase